MRSRTPVPALIISSFDWVVKYCTEPEKRPSRELNLRPASWPVPEDGRGALPSGSLALTSAVLYVLEKL
jgi:hypothetical protein